MSKISFYTLFVGVAVGVLIGSLSVYAALDHNPQMAYTENPEDLIPIFVSWMVLFAAPFSFLSLIIEGVRFLRGRVVEKRPVYILFAGVPVALLIATIVLCMNLYFYPDEKYGVAPEAFGMWALLFLFPFSFAALVSEFRRRIKGKV